MTDQRLQDKVAIITGAGRGIGRAIALAYAEAGADIVAAARSADEIAETVQAVEAAGRRGLALTVDITVPAEVERMVAQTVQTFDRIDILVNCAGQRAVASSTELSFDDWQRVLNVNLTGSFLCAQAAGRHMIEAGRGKIINIGSMQAHSGAGERAAYIASKTGLVGLTRALGVEWAVHGVNVNLLSPGYFHTEAIERQIQIGQLDLAAIERRTPANRIGQMEDLLGPAIFLASDESNFMCGQSLIVDGGWLAYGHL